MLPHAYALLEPVATELRIVSGLVLLAIAALFLVGSGNVFDDVHAVQGIAARETLAGIAHELPAGTTLAGRLDDLTADDRPAGSVFGFVAAEQSIVKPGRALLLERWGLAPEQIVVKGYWKHGEAEYHAPH